MSDNERKGREEPESGTRKREGEKDVGWGGGMEKEGKGGRGRGRMGSFVFIVYKVKIKSSSAILLEARGVERLNTIGSNLGSSPTSTTYSVLP